MTPQEIMALRKQVLPELGDYDETHLATVWLPYVMATVEPRVRTKAHNTDAFGFRYTVDRDGSHLTPEDGVDGPVSVFLGGSGAYGVGCTSDATTIPSLFSQKRGEPWLNLAVRGFTLAQNLLQYLFFRPRMPEIRRIVLFAGVNDISHFIRTPLYTAVYGTFFSWLDYFSKMNASFIDRRQGEINIPPSLSGQFLMVDDYLTDYGAFLEVLEGVLDNFGFLARAAGAEIDFVLQPASMWAEKPLSPDEQTLLGAVDDEARRRERLMADAYHGFYRQGLEQACSKAGIGFVDSNPLVAAQTSADDFIFVDSTHLSDDGCRLCAGIIEEYWAKS